MLQFYKTIVHLFYFALYALAFIFYMVNENSYHINIAKTSDTIDIIIIAATLILTVMAFFKKQKKYYYYMILPPLAEGLFSYIFSQTSGRYYVPETDEYVWWNPDSEGFYILLVFYIVFMILMFVKIKDQGNIWSTLK